MRRTYLVTRGWLSARAGTAVGVLVLAAALSTVGNVVWHAIPLARLQLVIGLLLTLFGLRWLIKAVLRYGGKIPIRDEDAAYTRTVQRLHTTDGGRRTTAIDRAGFGAALAAVVLEGSEVAFAILAFGARPHMLPYAVAGSAAGILMVALLGLALRASLVKAPENALKFTVGWILTALGTLWSGEGIGLHWPAGAATYLLLLVLDGALCAGLIAALRKGMTRCAASA